MSAGISGMIGFARLLGCLGGDRRSGNWQGHAREIDAVDEVVVRRRRGRDGDIDDADT